MRTRTRPQFSRIGTSIGLALLVLGSPLLYAAPTGPEYPPPGGVTFSGSGAAGQATGRTNFYTNLDPAAYGDLYWTFSTIANPYHSTQGATGNMTFGGYDAGTGIATWNSTANMVWETTLGTESVATKLVLQFQPHSGIPTGPLGSGWLEPVTAEDAEVDSLPDSWVMAHVSAQPPPADSFQVWYQFQTDAGTPLLVYYDATPSFGGTVQTGVSGGFYSTVPEPTTGLLVMLGAGALALARRRTMAGPC